MKTVHVARVAGLFWTLALFLSLGTIPPLEIERLEAVLIALFSLAPLILCGKPLSSRMMDAPRVGGLIMVLWLVATLSCAWSVAPPISLIYLGIFCVLPATILAILIADPSVRQPYLQSALFFTVVLITGLAGWALIQIFFMPEHLVYGQVRDPFSNPNIFAALLSLGIFMTLSMALQENNKRHYALRIAMCFIILCAFLGMAGKAASIMMISGLALLFCMVGKSILPAHWKALIAMLTGSVIVEIVIANLPSRANLVGQMLSLMEGNLTSSVARIDLWQATWAMIIQHPWLGTGYRSFFLIYPSFRLPNEMYSGGYMTHNDPLQLWAEIGVLGPVLFYAIGLGVFYRFLRYWHCSEDSCTQKSSILTLFIGCGVFIVHSHVDFPLYAMPTMMAFAIALAWLLTKTEIVHNAAPLTFMTGWPRLAQAMAITGPTLAVIMLFTPIMIGEYYTNVAERYMQHGDMVRFGDAVNAANKAGWSMNDRPYMQASRVPMGVLQAKGKMLPKDEQTKLFSQINGLLLRAEQRNKAMAGTWYQRGLMVQSLDPSILPSGYPTAENSFARALAINPLYLPARLRLADIYEKRGDKKETLDVLAAGIPWPYASPEAFLYFDRTEKLAKALKRDDLLPAISAARDRQKGRINVIE